MLVLWQALTCFALPCAFVYVSERRSRRIFLEESAAAHGAAVGKAGLAKLAVAC